MKRKLFISATLITCFAVCLAAVAGLAGKWKGSLKDQDGNDHQFHLVLNPINGEKLTGTAQAEGDPLAINEGKINGNNFSFNVKDPDGNVIPIDGKYIAVGDSISLNFTERDTKYHVTFVREDK
jgi:hypothetical protein